MYLFFRAMEVSVRKTLSMERICQEPTLHIREEMKRTVLNDSMVIPSWSVILTAVSDIECDVSDTLLEEIVDKWINIRSHSFAIGWIEQYTLQKKSLHKKITEKRTCKRWGLTIHDTCTCMHV